MGRTRRTRARASIDHHPTLTDGVVALLMMSPGLLQLWGTRSSGRSTWTAAAVALTGAAILPLVQRRRYPLAVLVVATAAVTAHALLDVQPAEWSVNALWLALRPDVVLMDIRMPPLDEIEATRRITSAALSFPTGC